MKFKIRMMVEPGDKTINKAVITRIDEKGVKSLEQMVLEGETVETDVMVDPGCGMLVEELFPPTIYDDEQKAAVKMTWEDVANAERPAPVPLGQLSQRRHSPEHEQDTKRPR